MPDRLIVSAIGGELESFDVGGGLEWLLDGLGKKYRRRQLAIVTNEKPGEDADAKSYVIQEYELEDGSKIRECTCPAFRYQQVPKPEQVTRGDVGLDMLGECKHLQEYRKRSRSEADRPENQKGLDDLLDGEGGGFR